MRQLVGIGYRRALASWLEGTPRDVGCLEVTAEHFFDGGVERLRSLRRSYPLFVHGLGLSLGTPGPLDPEDLGRFRRVVEAADPSWVSEHVAFTRTREVDLGHLNPVRPTRETLRVLSDHAKEVSDACGRRLLLENIATHLPLEGDFPEPEFLNRVCDASGAGLLLDVTNLFVNSRNHGFDPQAWLAGVDPAHVVQLHVVGYTRRGGRWHDAHAEPIQRDLMDLVEEVLARTRPSAVILERDERIPSPDELAEELRALESIHAD
jgi:uncharacterized protein (UPF0276 family)